WTSKTVDLNLRRLKPELQHFLLLTQSGPAVILPDLRGWPAGPGKEGSVLKRERVLVVDEISDTAEVLQAVLEPRGVIVNRVARLGQAALPTVENCPAVVVVCDAEALATDALPAGD